MIPYPLPLDTSEVLQHSLRKCHNPGLIFERYTPKIRKGKKSAQDKQKALQIVRDCQPDQRAMDAYRHRWNIVVTAANAITFIAQTDWRFVTGLGRNTPFEVGFTFHHLYGFPVISGSGLKGLARSWAYFCLKDEKPDSDPEEDPVFKAVFGHAAEGDDSAASAGGAIFFEAVPLDSPKLELDVMTPHFLDYYSDKKMRTPPADDQNPVPIPFLTVKEGVRFGFAVGWREEPSFEAHTRAVEWLKAGLENLGAGAKTAAGYGYFLEVRR